MIWFFYLLQFIVVILTVIIVMLQKSSDSIFSSNKIFGLRGRSSAVIKLTYFLCSVFFINSLFLCALYQKKYKEESIKEVPENIQSVKKG